ncbi:MAG: glycosyltransferase [Deltaproteobacteria bacterium]|nr:glycosyltransferase [Deltaproteobacteria bacterium]
MRLVIASPEPPFPHANATRLKVAHLIAGLAQRHEIHLRSFCAPEESRAAEAVTWALDHGCSSARITPWTRDPWRAPAIAHAALGVRPHTLRKYRVAAARDELRELVRRTPMDLVHLDINMSELRSCLTGSEATVISPSDSFTRLLLSGARRAPNLGRRAYYLAQASKFAWLELREYPRFTKCHVVSAPEARFLESLSPGADVAVVPIGVRVPPHIPDEAERAPDHAISLAGQLSNPYTLDGISWFLGKVWPRVRAAEPQLELRLLGHAPPAKLAHLAARTVGVKLVGYVEDLGTELRRTLLCVCPLLSGAGLKTRALEALAEGVPLVTTSVGAEGIAARPGRHLRVADTPATFAAAVLELLHNPVERRLLAVAAHDLAATTYTWRRFAEGMEGLYLAALAKRRAAMNRATIPGGARP